MRIINSGSTKFNVAVGRGLRAFTLWSWAAILVAVPLLLTAALWVAVPQPGQAQGAAPAKPTGLAATAGVAQAALTWDDPSDSSITGYEYLQAQVAKLITSDGAANDQFGFSVAVDGNTAVVGARYDNDNGPDSGSAYVYLKGSNTWSRVAKLTPSDGAVGVEFGASVAVDGETVVVGARRDGFDTGAAYVFTKPAGGWVTTTETAKLTASDGDQHHRFGSSVAADGDTVVVGSLKDDQNGPNSGSAYLFAKPADGWATTSTAAKLTATDGAPGDEFGRSVAVHGDTVVVGSHFDDDHDSRSGSAYIFTEPAGGWVTATETAKLTASDGATNHEFGRSVAVHGDTVVVGSHLDDDHGSRSGSAYLFTEPAGGWVTATETAKLTASDGATHDQFGRSVAVHGDTVVVGSHEDGDNGSAYLFTEPAGGWVTATETAKLTASDGANDDRFGWSVAVDEGTVVVGAPLDDEQGSDSGSAYVYQLSDWTGIPDSGSGQTNTTSYSVTGLAYDVEYVFWIRATNGVGNGPASAIVAVVPQGWPAPTNLVAGEDRTRVVLRWDTGDPGITHYLISSEITDGSGDPPPDQLVSAGSGPKTQAGFTSLTNGFIYIFRVQAAEVSGSEAEVDGASSSVVAAPTVAVPAAPANLTATPGDGRVTVTWDNPDNITIRKYQYSTDGGDTFNHMNRSNQNTTSYTFKNLNDGTEYTLAIRASNRSGESVPATVTATPSD